MDYQLPYFIHINLILPNVLDFSNSMYKEDAL